MVALAPLACGTERDAIAVASARDSAGIAIVESAEPRWGGDGGWRLSSDPAVRIGALEDNPVYELYQVSNAVRLSDGRIVVANSGTHELRFYDEAGTFLMKVGRQGGGPGEFEMLFTIRALAGDSVMAYDANHRRISIFDPQARFVRDLAIGNAEQVLFALPHGRLPDGSYLVESPSRQPGPAMLDRPTGRQRDSIVVLRLDATGGILDTMGIFPGLAMQITTVKMGDRGFPMPLAVPFSPRTTISLGSDRTYVGTSDTYEIRMFDVRGTLTRIVRRPHENRPVTDRDVATTRERMDAGLAQQSNPFSAQLRDVYRDIEYPETMPAYGMVIGDREGNLWVSETGAPDRDEARWTVFDRDGAMLGTVAIPRELRVTEIGATYVLGTMSDDLEIESVLLYNLIKPRT